MKNCHHAQRSHRGSPRREGRKSVDRCFDRGPLTRSSTRSRTWDDRALGKGGVGLGTCRLDNRAFIIPTSITY